MRQFLDFEKPIAVLEGKIEELRHLSTEGDINIAEEVGRLQSKITKELTQAYSQLKPWEKVQVARHPDRLKLPALLLNYLRILFRWQVIAIIGKIMP